MRFRWAEESDVALILEFICALAEYEGMREEVTADETLLKEWLFEKKAAEVLFVSEGEETVGFALYFYNFSTFLGKAGIYLEDLYVKPSHRGRGYGKALLCELASLAKRQGCGRLEWWCLDWNQPSIDFYQAMGAEAMSEWTVYRMAGKQLEQLAAQVDPIKRRNC